MFNKLKSFSEDVAKSFNEIQQGDPAKKHSEGIRLLRNGASILGKSTPEVGEMRQPEDESGADGAAKPSADTPKNGDIPSPESAADAPPDPLKDIDLDELPPIVRSKLKKFVKYEEKYPVLLDAYKTEKRKGELVAEFEKVLRDMTPVLSISDAGILVDYLKGVAEKSELSSTELRRAIAENTKTANERDEFAKSAADAQRDRGELQKKVSDLQKSLEYAEKSISEKAKAVEELELANSDLEQKLRTAENERDSFQSERATLADERDSLKEKNAILEEKLVALEKERDSLIGERDAPTSGRSASTSEEDPDKAEKEAAAAETARRAEEEIKLLQAQTAGLQKKLDELEPLQSQISDRDAEATELKTEIEKLNGDLKQKAQRIEELEIQNASKQKDVEAQLTRLQSAEKEVENLQEASKSPETADSPEAENTGSTPKKKRNKKKKGPNAAPPAKNEYVALPETFESLQKELTEKTELLEAAQTEIASLQEQLKLTESSIAERDDLVQKLKEARKDAESKGADLENLRDLLRDLGDELVTIKDASKLAETKWKADNDAKLAELSESEKALKAAILQKESEHKDALEKLELKLGQQVKEQTEIVSELEVKVKSLSEREESMKKSFDGIKAKLSETQQSLTQKDAELVSAKKSVESLGEEKAKLNQRIDELSKFKSTDSSLKLEIASLQSSISHKDEQIRELKDTIEKKNKERDELTNSIATLKAINKDLHATNQNLVQEKTQLIEKQELAVDRSNAMTAELSGLQVSRQKVITELEGLKLKYETLVRNQASALDEARGFRQQYEEMAMKSKETQTRIYYLEDELSEAKSLLQERTRELSTIRRMLIEAEEDHNVKISEYKTDLRNATQEKQELESELQLVIKKRQREIDELKSTCDTHVRKIKELELACQEIRAKYEPFASAPGVDAEAQLQKANEYEAMIAELRSSLQSSSKKVKDYENMNSMLKKLNEESSLKFERLSKNYKHMTQQYRQMKDHKSQEHKPETLSATPDKSDDANLAYLRNVLVGFLEHKEQREQLLPVLKMLFKFSADEEKTLMGALR